MRSSKVGGPLTRHSRKQCSNMGTAYSMPQRGVTELQDISTPDQDASSSPSKRGKEKEKSSLPAPPSLFRGRGSYGSQVRSLLSTSGKDVQPATPNMEADQESHFRFMDLPPEIRNMIYEELVVVGKVFYTPYNEDGTGYEDKDRLGQRCRDWGYFKKPELQLLRVCKRIHTEAESLYLAKNLFVLPVNWHRYNPVAKFEYCSGLSVDMGRRCLFSESGLRYIRNISFAVDQRISETPQLNLEWWTRWSAEYGPRPFVDMTERERLQVFHDKACIQTREDWTEMTSCLAYFSSTMTYVEVDFTNAFCSVGVCRPISYGVTDWIERLNPEQLDVIGVGKNERVDFFMGAHGYADITYEELYRMYGLRFRKSTDITPWDTWK